MQHDLKEIKQIRLQLGMTQSDLARRAGVSQSLIAKVESGRLDPTYTKAKQIFEALESIDRKSESVASEVMVLKTISCKPTESVQRAIQSMNKHNISQLPVLNKSGLPVGLVSESAILELLAEGKLQLSHAKVSDIMEEAPPMVSATTRVSAITPLLKHFPLVVVTEDGKLAGVITKADMLKVLAR